MNSFGLFVSVFSQLVWGMYPVFARYVGTRVEGKPSSVAILGCLAAFDTLVLLLIYACQRSRCFLCVTDTALLMPSTGPESDIRPEKPRIKLRQGLSYGALCLFRMLTNMQSARMTYAFNIQMTALLLPFFVAVLARLLLGELIERALLPSLLVTLVGSVLVLCGQGWDGVGLGPSDAAGIGLQLVSVFFSALIKIAHRYFSELSKLELMLSQMSVVGACTFGYALAADRTSLAAIAAMGPDGWRCFFGMAVGVYLIGNSTQIAATRSIGASNHAASNALRLVSACLFSAVVLSEPVQSALEWFGFVVIAAALLGYYVAQRRSSARRAAATKPTEHGHYQGETASTTKAKRYAQLDREVEAVVLPPSSS